ncbi:hypothetical protein ANCDUO_19591 [Ancylostoma duodenale]|uniref:Uncharacterized protein n=1 Tax=Ancylostoma duodenale TaxID=51022 RepID=A0A0C2FZT4_9BILA|nr:hypothetical protein ANCDUO_19591 [Ancylostoma duodenale]
MQFMGRIADILQEAGHDVVLFDLPKEVSAGMDPMNLNVWDQNSRSIVRQIEMLGKLTEVQIQSCDLLLGDNRTMEQLSKEHFDAGISELLAVCGFGLFNVSEFYR